MQWSDLLKKIYTLLTLYGLKVVSAVAIFVIGRWVAKGITRLIERLMVKRKVDETLVSFVSNLRYVALLAFVIIAALNKLGIQTASFIAVIGAAGLAIGLALQGSLSNFAAGILMIIFRPFKVGDYIEGAGVAGTVEAIQIFTTQLKTPDNKTIIIPNSKISSDNIVNYSTKGTRRVELVFGNERFGEVKCLIPSRCGLPPRDPCTIAGTIREANEKTTKETSWMAMTGDGTLREAR